MTPLSHSSSDRGFVRLLFSQAWTVLRKDLLLEWRGFSRFLSVLFFGLVTLALFAFAGDADTEQLRGGASGYLVLALFLSSTLALSESFRLENEEQGIEGLLLLPVDTTAFYYGKAIGNTLFLFLLGPVLTPVALVFYAVEFDFLLYLQILGLWVLTAAGLTAPGTLYAAMTSRLRSQDVLLPLLLFPLVIPILIASVKAIDVLLTGDFTGKLLGELLALLIVFDLVYWSICGILFHYVIEEA